MPCFQTGGQINARLRPEATLDHRLIEVLCQRVVVVVFRIFAGNLFRAEGL
jgi:hypothetical protein